MKDETRKAVFDCASGDIDESGGLVDVVRLSELLNAHAFALVTLGAIMRVYAVPENIMEGVDNAGAYLETARDEVVAWARGTMGKE